MKFEREGHVRRVRSLLRQSSESLAGRIAFHHLDGLSLDEVGKLDRLWIRGGFPRSYLARSAADSSRWRLDFIRTFLERDASEFGRAFGISHTTVRRYLDALTSLLVVRQLQS